MATPGRPASAAIEALRKSASRLTARHTADLAGTGWLSDNVLCFAIEVARTHRSVSRR